MTTVVAHRSSRLQNLTIPVASGVSIALPTIRAFAPSPQGVQVTNVKERAEAFSDILGVTAAFFHQRVGSGPLEADYLIGEDVITSGGLL